MSQERLCADCGQKLSAYNDDSICHSCIVNPKEVNKTLREIKGMANGKPKPNKS